MPRERISVSLPGGQGEMVRQGSGWVGRNAPDLSMRDDNGTWKVFDGNGLTYTFTQHPYLVGTGGPYAGRAGLWLLRSISGPGGAAVVLDYAIGSIHLPSSPNPTITIDLVRVRYNPHPSTGCFKHEVALVYQADAVNARPQAVTVFGERVLARFHRLAAVNVSSRPSCPGTPERLRSYRFLYNVDPDTRQEHLASVSVFGREGTPEGSISLPVASYHYGAVTSTIHGSMPALRYERTQSIPIPSGAAALIADTEAIPGLFQPPISGTMPYASLQSFTDFTGDGRPDLVFSQNGKLWIARNIAGMSVSALVDGVVSTKIDGFPVSRSRAL